MLTYIRPRFCDHCGAKFRPRVDAQRYCRRWCRAQAKAAEGRAARRVWWQAGRPMRINEERA
jgi:hypothetical protein